MIAAFRRLTEVWMVVPREMESEGTISHTTGLWQGAAPGVGLGRGGPIDADEEGQGVWVDETSPVVAVANDIIQVFPGPCFGLAHEEGNRSPGEGAVVDAVRRVGRHRVPCGVRR